ncbi:TPA: hypothetical protein TUI13_001350 [Streptococcus equi subsp. zooepidemicus]|uniref:hypothetical protein n=1 Tax=Streptococcus equi TaxID=1336 RepID=UPI001E2C5BC2|nr:hypothetical protein [Streptococcus equi]MCD3369437.1 hypothetical protein [Streptococcus equi subsp. zooepidemicus]MCD3372480.1 hypothetical protein [Streptococcus equi subsp. zooepidemicus]MCD3380785.1 hypothetical protein [Streptococcus equi subsp. zooepidemicus]UFR18489.1 hypothetical protein KV238_10600 [Streptococcus equi subsp. zooepidemicus]UFR18509.1 hypothetical protein KV238_00055 [Streptococcus equi subsp. zooepidemicus]
MKKLLLTSAAALALATVALSTAKVEAASHSQRTVQRSNNDTTSLSAARWGSRLQILNLLTQYKEKLRGGGFYFYQRKFRAEVGKAKTPDEIEKLYDKFREELEDLT